MTRKKALKQAIRIIKQSDADKEIKAILIEKLQLCIDELPFTRWTQAAIMDACEEYRDIHGNITLRDFDNRKELPSHTMIKYRFGMTAAEFRDKYFPLTYDEKKFTPANRKKVIKAVKDEIVSKQLFLCKQYDANRDRSLPCYATLVKRYGIKTWSEFLASQSITVPKKNQLPSSVSFTMRNTSSTYTFSI